MFRFKLILIIGLFSSSLFAQQDVSVPLGNRMYDVFELTPTASTQQFSVEVNSATALTIDIYTAVDPVIVTIEDPSGTTFPSSSINVFTVGATEVVPLGAFLFAEGIHQQALINNPAAGTWLVNVSLPNGAATIGGTMTVVQTGGLQAGTIISRPAYTFGESVVIAIAAFDSGVPSLGATAKANIYQEGSELTPQTIDLFDDGFVPDVKAGDGLYTGQISGLSSGDYLVETVFQSGTARITAGAQFEVIPPLGVITNNVTDTGIDTNADGLFDRIDIDLEVDIASPGTYDLLVELKLYAKTILKGKRVVLTTGISTQSVSFSAEDIRRQLNGDGPYEISDVRLIRNADADGTQPTRMADRRTDLGSTQPYQLQQLQRPLTVILEEGFTEVAVDTNGNAKFDVLNFNFRIDALAVGAYTWSASLKALDGTTIATASQVGSLSAAGTFTFPLSFDGAAIGAAGFDGPYILGDIGVYGPPNAAAIKLKLGETIGYTASQFEGFVAPTANPGGPYSAVDGQPIVFDGSASSDPDADPLTYLWDFGDGSSASGVSPSHAYASPGIYTVTLVVNDGQFNSSPVSTTVTVTPSNFAPTANPGGPYSAVDGLSIIFDGSASSDPDADPLTYAWNFGDGSSASGVSPSHAYALPGTYTVTLVANDGKLNSSPVSTTVTVTPSNFAPTANPGGPYSAVNGQSIMFDGSASSDPDADLLTYLWNFGDGSSASGVNPGHAYSSTGTYTVTLVVNDGQLNSLPASTTVSVVPPNVAPISNAGGPYSGIGGTPIIFDGSVSSDINGDILSFSWDFGDGSTGSGVSPSHIYTAVGIYTVTLVVNDGFESSAPDTVTVSVGNAVPVANAGVDQSGFVRNVIVLDGSASNDPNNDSLTYRWNLISKPAGSNAVLTDVFSVNPRFEVDVQGDYVMQLIINDGTVDSQPDTVLVTVVNRRPVAEAESDAVGDIFTGRTINLDGSNSFDPDGDAAITYQWIIADKPQGSLAQFDDSTSATASFVIDVAGDYIAQLVVNDGQADSDPDNVFIEGVLSCIDNFAIRPKFDKMALTWDFNPELEIVEIERATNIDGPYEVIAESTSTYASYLDSGLDFGSVYYYRINGVFPVDNTAPIIECNDVGEGAICNGNFCGFDTFPPTTLQCGTETCQVLEVGNTILAQCGGGLIGGAGLIPGTGNSCAPEDEYCQSACSFFAEDPFIAPLEYPEFDFGICQVRPTPVIEQRFCKTQIIASTPIGRIRTVKVPDIIGMTIEQAQLALQQSRLTLGEVTFESTTAVPAGRIIRQDVPRNSVMPPNTAIKLVVATRS